MQYQAQQPFQQQQAYSMPVVGVGRRFVAVLLDAIIIGVIGAILNGILGVDRAAISGSATGVVAILYFIVMEATSSATLGKMIMGLRVVRQDGAPISWTESIIRNLLRIIDALPFAYIVGAILIWTSPLKQRLGDRVAHTLVVRKPR